MFNLISDHICIFMYGTENGQPRNVVKSFVPFYNSLSWFEVCEASHHQVIFCFIAHCSCCIMTSQILLAKVLFYMLQGDKFSCLVEMEFDFCSLITDHVSMGGNAVSFVHLSVHLFPLCFHLFLSVKLTDLWLCGSRPWLAWD